MLPESGLISPAMVFSVVDLPAPFAPMRVTISPSSMSNEIPLTALMAPYETARSLTESMAIYFTPCLPR